MIDIRPDTQYIFFNPTWCFRLLKSPVGQPHYGLPPLSVLFVSFHWRNELVLCSVLQETHFDSIYWVDYHSSPSLSIMDRHSFKEELSRESRQESLEWCVTEMSLRGADAHNFVCCSFRSREALWLWTTKDLVDMALEEREQNVDLKRCESK